MDERLRLVISDITQFLRYFDGINRRALRDVSMLPDEAQSWTPPGGEGEGAWSIGQIVEHMGLSRGFFVRAYSTTQWRFDSPGPRTDERASWLETLQTSAALVVDTLTGTPAEWLSRRVPLIEGEGSISGWRVLMMMVEHDVHHRSQIDTYAGLNGWPVAQIFDRTYEEVAGLAKPN